MIACVHLPWFTLCRRQLICILKHIQNRKIKIVTAISALRTCLIFRCFDLFYMALDVLRCDLGTKKCASATLLRHTAAGPAVGFNIFMYQNCVSNQGGAVAANT